MGQSCSCVSEERSLKNSTPSPSGEGREKPRPLKNSFDEGPREKSQGGSLPYFHQSGRWRETSNGLSISFLGDPVKIPRRGPSASQLISSPAPTGGFSPIPDYDEGLLAMGSGHNEKAMEVFEDVLSFADSTKDFELQAACLLRMAEVHMRRKNPQAAAESLGIAKDRAAAAGGSLPLQILSAAAELVLLLFQKDWANADKVARLALGLVEQWGSRDGPARARLMLGIIYTASGGRFGEKPPAAPNAGAQDADPMELLADAVREKDRDTAVTKLERVIETRPEEARFETRKLALATLHNLRMVRGEKHAASEVRKTLAALLLTVGREINAECPICTRQWTCTTSWTYIIA